MKKLFLTLGIILAVSSNAIAAEKYAMVNVEYVMSKYKAAQQATEWMRQEEIKMQKFVTDARLDLEKTPNAQKKAKEEKYNKQLQDMAAKLKQQEEAKSKAIFDGFDSAVKKVSKDGGYSLVVPAALYGATDISEDVVKALK